MMYTYNHEMWNFWMLGIFVMVLLAIVVANDAVRFGENGLLWAIVVLFMPMMGILVYVIVRSSWTGSGLRQYRNPNIESTASQPITDQGSFVKRSHVSTHSGNTIQYCITCGSENKSIAIYCNSCGTKIIENS